MAKRLLVLDPEAKFSSIASVALKSAGWETSTAKTFDEARELVIAIAPDAMLCPNVVEGMDEATIVKDIRAQRNGSALPIILLGAKSHFGPHTYLTPTPLSASALSILITKIETRREDMGLQVENFDQAFDSIMQDRPVAPVEKKVLKLEGEARPSEPRTEAPPAEKKSVEPSAPAAKPAPPLPVHLSEPETWVIKKPASASSEPVLRLEEAWIVTAKEFEPGLEAYRLDVKKQPSSPPKFGLAKAAPAAEEVAPAAAAATAAAAVAAAEPAVREKAASTGELKSFFGKIDESSLEEGGVEELELGEPVETAAPAEPRPLAVIAPSSAPAPTPAEESDMETDLSEGLEESFEFEEFEAVSSAPPPEEAKEEEPAPEAKTPEPEPVSLESEIRLEEEAPSIGDLEKIFQEMYPAAGKREEGAAGEESFDEARALELLDSHLEASFGTPKPSPQPEAAAEPVKEELFVGEEEELALAEPVEELQAVAGEAVAEEAPEEKEVAPLLIARPAEEAGAEEFAEQVDNIEEEAPSGELEYLLETTAVEAAPETGEPAPPSAEEAEVIEEDVEMLPAVLSPEVRLELESYFKGPDTEEPEEEKAAETGVAEEQVALESPEEEAERFVSISEEPEEPFELESPAEATLYAGAEAAGIESLDSGEPSFGEIELEPPLAALAVETPAGEEEISAGEALAEEILAAEAPAEEELAEEFFEEEEVAEEAKAAGEQKQAASDFFDFASIEEELSEGAAETAAVEEPPATAPPALEEFEFSSVEEELSGEPSGIAESLLAEAASVAQEKPLSEQTFDFAAAETEVKVPVEVLSGPSAVLVEDFDFETAEEELTLPVEELFPVPAKEPELAVAGDGHPTDTHELDFDELDGVLGELEEFTPSLDVRGGFSFEPVEAVSGTQETDGAAAQPWKKAAALAAEAASKSIADSGVASSLNSGELAEIIRKAVEKAVEESMGGASGK
ncbi:hypothetical protein EPN96_12220 [bacterium]|nr:MAG: hypothetical protein EPN96_12220 [bacterium]